MTPQASSMDILRIVAAKHRISVDDITGNARNKRLWAARREAVMALREAKVPLSRIAYVLKRGKTTIDHYINPKKDSTRRKKSYADKNGKSVRLDPEITRLVTAYASGRGVGIGDATNALLRGALGGHS